MIISCLFINDNDCCKSCVSFNPFSEDNDWCIIAWKPNTWTRHQLNALKMFDAFFALVFVRCNSFSHAVERRRRSLRWIIILATAGGFGAQESIGFNRSTAFLRVTSPRITDEKRKLIFSLDVLHEPKSFSSALSDDKGSFFCSYTEWNVLGPPPSIVRRMLCNGGW